MKPSKSLQQKLRLGNTYFNFLKKEIKLVAEIDNKKRISGKIQDPLFCYNEVNKLGRVWSY